MTDFGAEMEDMVPETIVHTVAWDHVDGIIEITYAELREQVDGVGLLRTIAVERELFNTEARELESDLRDLIDEALLVIRNEDVRKQRIDRAKTRLTPPDDE